MAEPKAKSDFPLHWAVYVDDVPTLRKLLQENKDIDVDALDCRGRTPLMLAATLGHKDCILPLLQAGADSDAQNKEMWSVSHEAIAHQDAGMLHEIIKHRDYQRNQKAARSARKFLSTLKDTPDFYCEMGWEFSSWVPFVSRMCPSDTYKIYKQGSRVRIDTTLLGFEGTSWKRGNQSFIFGLDEDVPYVTILDHEASTASRTVLKDNEPLDDFGPSMYDVEQRLKAPTSTTYIDIEKIGFERCKTGGILSWISSSERVETVDGYESKVFDASNVNLVTKIRMEHLSAEDKARFKQAEANHSFSHLLSFMRSENVEDVRTHDVHESGLTATEYLDPDFPLGSDIGKAKEVHKKSNNFKATLWLAEEYPLNFQEQILPIVELMSSSSAHFARLQNFMRMQLPAGFPVKIEIPLFHVVSARITFGKVNEPGRYVVPLETGTNFKVNAVSISDDVFEVPATYRNLDDIQWWPDDLTEDHPRHTARYPSAQEQEDMLIQLAIQQSLRETGAAGSNSHGSPVPVDDGLPGYYDSVDADLARAIEESLRISRPAGEEQLIEIEEEEDDLTRAIRISQEETSRQAREEEVADEELQRVLALSMLEK